MARTRKDSDAKKWSTGPKSRKRQYQKEANRLVRRESKRISIEPEDEESFLNPVSPNSILRRYW